MKRWIFLLVLFLVIVAVACFKRPTIETSLLALVGEDEIQMVPEVLNRGNGEIQVLFIADDKSDALAVAEHYHARLNPADYKSIRFKLAGDTMQQLLAFYQTYATGLLAPRDAALLAQGKTAQVAKTAMRQWYTTPASLYDIAEDPFRLLNHFITSRTLALSGWQAELNGVLSTDLPTGEIAILLSLSVKDDLANNLDRLIPLVADLKASAAELNRSNVEISLSGVPLHTVEVASRCKREITWLSIFSLTVILITAWVALRSFRVYPYILFVLLLSCGVGIGATLLCFSSIHLLAGVFATTLLGLTIDYAFHGLLATEATHLKKNLLCSWITTEISLLPLLFSGLSILVQSAVFMMAGLAAAFLGVCLTFKPAHPPVPPSTGFTWASRRGHLLPIGLFLVLLPFTCFVSFGTNLQDIYAPSPALREAEQRFYALTFPGGETVSRGMAVVEGDTIEALIEREEALSLPAGTSRLSNFLPSYRTRCANYAHLTRLYAEEAKTFSESLSLKTQPVLTPPVPWTFEILPPFLRDNFIVTTASGTYLTIIPNVQSPETLPDGVAFYHPQREIQRTIDHLASTTQWLLLAVGCLLLIVLAILFRGRAWKIALPSLLAVSVVFVSFGTCGRTLNLFHLLACFMLIGISLDYTIFFASDAQKALRPITASFFTSLAGFGALACVSFMVVRSIGEVFAVGLTVAYLAAFFLFRNPQPAADGETAEVAASPLGLTLLLVAYRLFGKGTLAFFGWVIANVLWCSSRKVRQVTRTRARLVSFVQSMVDKFVVMSQGRGQPHVEIEDHPETRAFISDVTSRRGVFMLTSHFGSMEVLPAILDRDSSESVPLYAFMQLEQTAVFNRFYLSQMKRTSVFLRPVTGFGMAEFFEAGTHLDNGACVLMAGDRVLGSAAAKEVSVLGHKGYFPKGVYRFAKLLEYPIYFVVCYRVRRNVYRVAARAIAPDERMVESFIGALEPFVQAHPEQWYHWEMLSV